MIFLPPAACHPADQGLRFSKSTRVSATEYGSAPHLEAIPSLPLCGDRSPTACPLERESAFANTPDGRVFFVSSSTRLTELGPTGLVVRTFGAPAGEPGSYGSAAAVSADSGGNVGILDIRGWSWIGFGSQGARTNSVAIPPNPTLVDFHAHAGHVVLRLVPAGDSLHAPVVSTFVSVGAGGWAQLPFRVPTRAVSLGNGMTPLRPLFSAKPAWDLQADGRLVYAEGDAYRLSWFAPDGSPLQSVVVDGLVARPVTPADVDHWMAAIRSAIKGHVEQRASIPIPKRAAAKTHPAITDLRCLSDSTVLVRGSPRVGGDSVRWDLWGDDGQLLGRFVLGSADKVIGGTRDRILVATLPPESTGRIRWVNLSQQSKRISQ